MEWGSTARERGEPRHPWSRRSVARPAPLQRRQFAAVDDLEFMYVFNLGGTMTESSNYDGAPPVPPAYGIWRQVGPGRFEVRYEFYPTRAPARLDDLMAGGGWSPAGRGVFFETITVSDDGETFASQIRYEAFDRADKPVAGGGEGSGLGVRLRF